MYTYTFDSTKLNWFYWSQHNIKQKVILHYDENKDTACSDTNFDSLMNNFNKCVQRSADTIFLKFQTQEFRGTESILTSFKKYPF